MKIPVSYKRKAAGILYSVKAFSSSAKIMLSGKRKRSNHYLEKIRNTAKRRRCFVLGNGPSLIAEDLDKLKNEVTFASNRIYKVFPETDWRPTYYGMVDEKVALSEGVIDGINSFKCKKKFFIQEGYFAFKGVKGDPCWLHAWYQRKYLKNPRFSDDLTKGMYSIATVTYMLIQIAAYMGFSEIYLLGCDNVYAVEFNPDGSEKVNKGVKNYFGSENKDEKAAVGASWESNIAFSYAERYSREHGFRIYNATRGGALEVFERKNLDEVLKCRNG